ncbi:glycoside hydrolase family 2 protein [Promicromonospora panici]|uniref:glycoside hydrolase family 2 protein n=1 Tax=Promicromonospora panici TaxID=2219658 RepID=UPI00101C6C20|nr:glycoside hydrolase family 2 TIM barrel-domain containing protein [Promicromonospora panici]
MIREQRFINDDWTFDYGEHSGAELKSPSPEWYDVGLPHSFDLPDFREPRFYVGHGCYRRCIDVPEAWIGNWVAVEFLGVFQVAEVFVNGRLVGRHEGGYTPFVVDISDAVAAGPNDGIGVTTPVVDAERAEVNASVEVVNDEPGPVEVTVSAVLTAAVSDDGGPVASSAQVRRTIAAGETAVVELAGAVDQPVLWHPDHPHLYTLTVSIVVDGRVRDRQATAFGVRWFEFTADRGFFLNGERLDLHGANVHQNRGGWGDAGTRAGIRRDVAMVKDLGMNIVRGSHYPHHSYFAEEYDRQGLLFWSELHFWGIGGENVEGYWFASAYPVHQEDEPKFEESLRRALREMIRTHRNHPSIVTWSVGNEAFFSDDHVIGKAKALTSELVDLSHVLDPTRPAAVGGAQRKGFDVLGDLAGYNGDGAEIFHDQGIPNLVSEYHGVRGRGPGEYEVTSEHGVEVDHPWRSGKILWCAFHYKSIAPGAGLQGLVDYVRTPRRPYYWYREKMRGIAPPSFPEPGTAVALRLSSDAPKMPTDGTGDVRLVVELLDSGGARVADDRAVTLTVVDGGGLFPSGRSITLSPETDGLWDGAGAIELRSYEPGAQRIRATSPGLLSAELDLVATGPARPQRTPQHARRLAPSAPYVTDLPAGTGEASLTASRPVTACSAQPGHEGSNVTALGSGTFWRAALRGPGEWIAAIPEFSYEISRIVIVFAEVPKQPWLVETGTDGRVFEPLHEAGPGGAETSVRLEFEPCRASVVRLTFPDAPLDVEEIRAY